ncbi:MAG: cobyrinate a,c-diamide synthase [Candidatus Rokuibacteriota bacterium]
MSRILVVAGAASGVGKTSVTLGLLEAVRRRGLTVQAFKVGPDFIDPGFHALVTGRPSYNLDGWMCGRDEVMRTVAAHGADADLCIVEGVMGLYDGVDGAGDDGSTAQVAKWLRAPVVLVLDAAAQARSAAAVALGFERFDGDVRIAGVIANRVGGDTHARWIAQAVRAACHAPLLGAIPYDAGLALPERHLGLVTAAEGPLTPVHRRRLGDEVATRVDLDALWAAAAPLPRGPAAAARAAAPRATIGVARDAAFQFYYADNLDRLREAGASIVFWSPLADEDLPDVDGLYIGGGYPEVHARALADNVTLRKAVRRFAEAGRPIYAECGGLMFLADSLVDAGGVEHPMAGVLPSRVSMRPPRMSLGYAGVTLTAAAPLGEPGTMARGQEFHFSTLDPVPDSIPRVYALTSPEGHSRREGYLIRRALLSYVHIHFASNPSLARAFVDACAAPAA